MNRRFMASLRTVAKEMAKDHERLSRSEFLERYGHLRPGTYDILSLRYDEAFDLYFSSSQRTVPTEPATLPESPVSAEVIARIDERLARHDL